MEFSVPSFCLTFRHLFYFWQPLLSNLNKWYIWLLKYYRTQWIKCRICIYVDKINKEWTFSGDCSPKITLVTFNWDLFNFSSFVTCITAIIIFNQEKGQGDICISFYFRQSSYWTWKIIYLMLLLKYLKKYSSLSTKL